MFHMIRSLSTITLVTPSGFSVLRETVDATGHDSAIADMIQVAFGASGAINWPNTGGDNSEEFITGTVALRPVSTSDAELFI